MSKHEYSGLLYLRLIGSQPNLNQSLVYSYHRRKKRRNFHLGAKAEKQRRRKLGRGAEQADLLVCLGPFEHLEDRFRDERHAPARQWTTSSRSHVAVRAEAPAPVNEAWDTRASILTSVKRQTRNFYARENFLDLSQRVLCRPEHMNTGKKNRALHCFWDQGQPTAVCDSWFTVNPSLTQKHTKTNKQTNTRTISGLSRDFFAILVGRARSIYRGHLIPSRTSTKISFYRGIQY